MKKKAIIGIVAAAMVLTMTIGGTLAYFTDKEEATNVVTMGHIDIELNEKMLDENDEEIDYVDPTNVKPGDEISKIPYVSNVCENDCYIRVKLEITNPTGVKEGAEFDVDGLDIDAEKWEVVAEDGFYYCYYKEVLAAGEQAPALFTTVSVPERWGNEVAEQEFSIALTAEGIQADNFEPTVVEGKLGWFYSDNTAITAENYVE